MELAASKVTDAMNSAETYPVERGLGQPGAGQPPARFDEGESSPTGNRLPIFHVVGFTGHRRVADKEGVARAIREVLTELNEKATVEWIGLSSVADGSDLIFARTALDLKLGWEALLPLSSAEFRTDFDPVAWANVQALLGEAEQVRVLSERAERNDAYLDCGTETVNHCDLLLAVWDGLPANGRGGTAEVVAYAREIGRPVIVIDPVTLVVRRERMEALKSGDYHLARLNQLPAAESRSPETGDWGLRTVLQFQQKVDAAASHSAPHFRLLTTVTIGLHVLATGLATASLAFDLHVAALPWGKLACLFGALGVAVVLRQQHKRHDWVRCRLAAEIARSALATWGLPRAARLFEHMDWSGLAPLRRSLDVLHRRSARLQPETFEGFKERYLRERIDGQLAYFVRNEQRSAPLLRRLRAGFMVTSVLAILCTAAYAINTVLPVGTVPRWFEAWVFGFGPIILPVLAACCMSLISINDLHRRVARYREMRGRLETARKEASSARTWGALEHVITKVERALLQEVFEWHSVTSFTESH